MNNLVPRLISHPVVREALVFVPQKVAELCSSDQQNLITWSNSEWIFGYHRLKDQVRRFAPDIIYVPNGTWIDFGKIPIVTMIRNMEALAKPFGDNPYQQIAKNLLRRSWAKLACHKSTRIIAVSRFVQEYLVSQWKIPIHQTDVVPHGIDDAPSPESMKEPMILRDKQYPGFFFTAGSLVSYRGLEDVIHAVANLKAKNHLSSYKLLIAGESFKHSSQYLDRIKHLAAEQGVGSFVIWLGHLSSAEMSWCYHNCEAFIMTSRLEACPNIVLEALSHGCVNISTSDAPMPEFFGEAAFYYKAYRPQELKDLMLKVMGLSSLEKQLLREKSRTIAKRFTWDNTAEKTVVCLQKAIALSKTKTYVGSI